MRSPVVFTMTALAAIAAGLSACGGGEFGEAELTGAIGNFTFGDEVSAYHNTGLRGEVEFTHIVLVDRKIDCIDMGWTTNNYFFDPPRVKFPFAAVQFSWSAPVEESTYSLVAGDGPVDGWRIIAEDIPANADKEVDADTSEEGTVTLTSVSGGAMVGNFEALFADGNVSGTFTTSECRNVR